MPLFIAVHTAGTGDAVTDLDEETHFGVIRLRSWVSEPAGKVFHLIEADDAGLLTSPRCTTVDREIYPVAERIGRQPGFPHEEEATRRD